jgi:hypothetical protein
MAKKTTTVWGVKETKIGGVRGRIVRMRGSKEFAMSTAAGMRRLYGGRFTYRVVKVPPAA